VMHLGVGDALIEQPRVHLVVGLEPQPRMPQRPLFTMKLRSIVPVPMTVISAMPVIMVMIVICSNNIIAVGSRRSRDWRNGCRFRCAVSGDENNHCGHDHTC